MGPEILAACRKAAQKKHNGVTKVDKDADLIVILHK
jgi:hypothetical protein